MCKHTEVSPFIYARNPCLAQVSQNFQAFFTNKIGKFCILSLEIKF